MPALRICHGPTLSKDSPGPADREPRPDINPLPSSVMVTIISCPFCSKVKLTRLAGSYALPCRMALIMAFAHGHGNSAARVFVQARLRRDLIGHFFGLVHAFQRGLHPVRNALWRRHQGLVLSRSRSASSALQGTKSSRMEQFALSRDTCQRAADPVRKFTRRLFHLGSAG